MYDGSPGGLHRWIRSELFYRHRNCQRPFRHTPSRPRKGISDAPFRPTLNAGALVHARHARIIYSKYTYVIIPFPQPRYGAQVFVNPIIIVYMYIICLYVIHIILFIMHARNAIVLYYIIFSVENSILRISTYYYIIYNFTVSKFSY